MRVKRPRIDISIAAVALFTVQGCTTIYSSHKSGSSQLQVAEHEALRLAAADLFRTPWRKPEEASLSDRLTGILNSGGRFSRADAINSYVKFLNAGNNPRDALVTDAEKNLAAARAMIKIAYSACESASPQMADVALIEDSISSLRETRAIYLTSYKKIDGNNVEIGQLEDSFEAALKELGEAADTLAENAIRKRTSDFASGDDHERFVGSF